MKRTGFYNYLRSVVVVDRGTVGHYCLAPSDPYLGLAGIKGKKVDTPTVVVDAASEETPPLQSPQKSGSNQTENGSQKKRVHLHAPAHNIVSGSGPEDPLIRSSGSRLFAVTLRLRVTQIVAGIIMVLLGSVACLESTVRGTLGVGIPAGVLTVVASIANIQVGRRYFTTNAMDIQAQGHLNSIWNSQTPVFRNFRPFLPTLACVLANLPLLALSCMAVVSTNRNKLVLGWLLGAASVLVISTEASVWLLRYRYIMRSDTS